MGHTVVCTEVLVLWIVFEYGFDQMRRTSTLRLLVIDRSELAKNMYGLLFRDLPGYRLEFADNMEGLGSRQRRARPHVVLINSNALENIGVSSEKLVFMAEYPTIVLSSSDRLDLRRVKREHKNVTLLEKPFYPYDLITLINRLASVHNPLSRQVEPAPAPKRRRLRRKGRA